MSSPLFDPNDEGFRLLVSQFAGELAGRADGLEEAFKQQDWQTLRRLAHQLKGAAGSYGFGELTPLAASVQYACDEQQTDEGLAQAVARLVDGCQKIAATADEGVASPH